MPHDGLVIAGVELLELAGLEIAERLALHRELGARPDRRRLLRDDAIHRLDQLGGELAVGPQLGGFLRVRMRVDVAALAGERARHRVQADDAHSRGALRSLISCCAIFSHSTNSPSR